jgi:hypothetical protein
MFMAAVWCRYICALFEKNREIIIKYSHYLAADVPWGSDVGSLYKFVLGFELLYSFPTLLDD